ncbi:M15 family metallopeptidase [Vibrio coralliilyticus]
MNITPEQLTGKVSTHLTDTMFGQKVFAVHPNVENDLQALRQAAAQAGFNLNIASGFRDFERQKAIWNRKMAGQTAILDQNSQPLDNHNLSDLEKVMAILRWSALPGASRHHWGCDFDVFDRSSLPQDTQLQLEPWEYLTGHQAKFYRWLKDSLTEFGFFFPYAKDQGGVAAEPWHISHSATASSCLSQLSLETLQKELINSGIQGEEMVLSNLETIYNQFVTNISNEVD